MPPPKEPSSTDWELLVEIPRCKYVGAALHCHYYSFLHHYDRRVTLDWKYEYFVDYTRELEMVTSNRLDYKIIHNALSESPFGLHIHFGSNGCSIRTTSDKLLMIYMFNGGPVIYISKNPISNPVDISSS
jgi:hypothetical protein